MSREIIIASWCDHCEAQEIRTPATHTYTVGLVKGENRPALRVIELCDTCDPILAVIFDLIGKHSIALETARTDAIKSPPPGVRPETLECRVCGEVLSRSSIITHVWSQHRPGEGRPAQPSRCPDCREVYAPAGMSMHRTRAHGWSALEVAYEGIA